MIGGLWFVAQVTMPVIIAFGVFTDDRLGWVGRPWWLAVVTVTIVDLSARFLVAGHLTLAAIGAVASLTATALTARAIHADLTPTGRHLSRSEPTP